MFGDSESLQNRMSFQWLSIAAKHKGSTMIFTGNHDKNWSLERIYQSLKLCLLHICMEYSSFHKLQHDPIWHFWLHSGIFLSTCSINVSMTNMFFRGFRPIFSLPSLPSMFFNSWNESPNSLSSNHQPFQFNLKGESLVVLTDKKPFLKVSSSDYLQQRSVVQFIMILVVPKVHWDQASQNWLSKPGGLRLIITWLWVVRDE